jgi:DNA-binding NtrC family response regulator
MSHERPIMLIDDDPSLLEALPPLLQRRLPDVPIEVVSSASAALSQLAMRRYGAIMSDVRMPVMDGWQLLQTVTAQYPDTPVLLMSAYLDPPDVLHALSAGAYDVILKPLSPTFLAERIRQALIIHRCLRRIKARQLLIARARRQMVVMHQILDNAQGRPVPIQNPVLAKRIVGPRHLKRMTVTELKMSLEQLKAHIHLLQAKANGTTADIRSAYAQARLFARQRAAGL